jgi:DNA invertase Pin-like site-specific DNA recombinase
MATLAYLRVSTDKQEVENQQKGITEYAAARSLVIDRTYHDTASGKTHWKHRELGILLTDALAGDVLLVAEISRLARSTLQVLEILQYAAQVGIVVHVVKSRLVMDGTMQSKIIATVFGLAAEIEREFIAARTKEALSRRKLAGLPMGRPAGEAKTLKLDALAADLDKWRAKKLGWASMAKLADCSRSTLYAWAARRRPAWIKEKNPDE